MERAWTHRCPAIHWSQSCACYNDTEHRLFTLVTEGTTYSVRMILLPSDTSSAFRCEMPLPFVFRPPSVSPFPLKLSQLSPPLLTVVPLEFVPANCPANDDDGREDPGEDESTLMLSFDAMVGGGAFFGLSGSTATIPSSITLFPVPTLPSLILYFCQLGFLLYSSI